MSEVIRSPDAHRTIWQVLADKDYRDGYAEGQVADFLASQIFSMRTARNWNQAKLADVAGTTQPQICTWEQSCDGIGLTSLHKLASAFDVALTVKFVPFSQMAKEATSVRSDLTVPSFEDDSLEAIRTSSISMQLDTPRHKPRKGSNATQQYLSPFEITASSAFGS